jgi:DNA-binding response OmpR family regulator
MASILIVDDEAAVRAGVAAALKKSGHATQEAQDAREASRMVATEKFDLIITDLVMPERHGFELLMNLPKHDRPAVIVMTGMSGDFYRRAASGLGAARLLAKPFTIDRLLETVNEVLSLHT